MITLSLVTRRKGLIEKEKESPIVRLTVAVSVGPADGEADGPGPTLVLAEDATPLGFEVREPGGKTLDVEPGAAVESSSVMATVYDPPVTVPILRIIERKPTGAFEGTVPENVFVRGSYIAHPPVSSGS